MKNIIKIAFLCSSLISGVAFAQSAPVGAPAGAPIFDPGMIVKQIDKAMKDADELSSAVEQAKISTLSLISLGGLSSLGAFLGDFDIMDVATNALSTDVVDSLSVGGLSGTKADIQEQAASTAKTAATSTGKFDAPTKIKENITKYMEIPDDTSNLTTAQVRKVRNQVPQTRKAIATYAISLAWVNRSIASQNIKKQQEKAQETLNGATTTRKAIAATTVSNNNIAETYNRLLTTAATINALGAANQLQQAGNLSATTKGNGQ